MTTFREGFAFLAIIRGDLKNLENVRSDLGVLFESGDADKLRAALGVTYDITMQLQANVGKMLEFYS